MSDWRRTVKDAAEDVVDELLEDPTDQQRWEAEATLVDDEPFVEVAIAHDAAETAEMTLLTGDASGELANDAFAACETLKDVRREHARDVLGLAEVEA